MGSHHQQVESFEIIFNRQKHDALPGELKAILRWAAFASGSDMLGLAYHRYSKDLDEIKRRGVSVVKTGDNILNDQLAAWDKVISQQSSDPFFRKVIESQKAWVKRTAAYLQTNNLDSSALSAAYRHFFG
jgi:TRAP-type mannitol/chloroaromatic compound transport system substrate-binding protein